MVRSRYLIIPVVLAIALAILAVPSIAQEEETVKVTVLETTKFTNLTAYMYDDANKKLLDINTTYVEVLDYELNDKDSSDSYMPAVVLSLDAPSTDLNTNESIVYAWVLYGSYGDSLLVAVADINSTDNLVINMSYYKVSPVSGDVAIVRTNYDINIQSGEFKLSIPLSGFTNPKVIVMTDTYVTVTSLSHLELRALQNPPSGYSLIRSGSGEAEFTISASGTLYIWFDEEHDAGDVDLFAFDRSHPSYSSVSLSNTWSQLVTAYNRDRTHAAMIWSDAYPQTGYLTSTSTVKIIVKLYAGNAGGVSWRVAARLASTPSPEQTTTPSQTQPPSQSETSTPSSLSQLWGQVQNILGGQNTSTIIAILLIVFIIIAIIAIARR